MTVRQCICKHKIKPDMLVYRHFCGGTIVGLVVRVNDRSVRIRKLNDACTCVSQDQVTLKFKPSRGKLGFGPNCQIVDNLHVVLLGSALVNCWCVTDIHELTPEVAQEKYFRDMLLGCNPYIAKKIGWTERMSVQPETFQKPTAKQIDELIASSPSFSVKQHTVTEFISAGKYRGMDGDRLQSMLRADLEIATGAATALRTNCVSKRQLDLLWSLAWKHADVDRNGLHDVVYWYDELLPLVKWP